ncbi:ATP-grasp domain-containing protein [Staphylococcus aureus]|uniref:ATP-grasp domain-containing protein n=1 Tax=Staphylococcus aureus TaxID=1280 RepID=UPI0027E561F0|nr:RimK family alpha-L-glutamate ligase [Staphylococcus aureus]
MAYFLKLTISILIEFVQLSVDDSDTIKICTDKLIQSNIFSNHNLPTPEFEAIFPETTFPDLYNKFKTPFVIKPVNSSWGRGIVKIDSHNDFILWKEVSTSLDLKNQNYPYLAQEYIIKENYDIRALVINNKIVGLFKRVSNNNWKTNTHLGAEIKPIEITEEISDIINKISIILPNAILGVDLLFDVSRQKYIICEVNNNPEFAKSSKIYKKNIGEIISEFVTKEPKNDKSEERLL